MSAKSARAERGRSISICPTQNPSQARRHRRPRRRPRERLDANRLIEEFMILANVAAAETLEKARVPLIYRVHDEPSDRKAQRLARIPGDARHSARQRRRAHAGGFNGILARVKGDDAEQLVNEVVLRTQAQAEYAAENYGHFGLNLRRYAHFTSPIRRYADLIVHRGLIRALKLGDDGLPDSDRQQRWPKSPRGFPLPSGAPCWPSARPMTG